MESDTALLRAASGLERLMVGMPKGSIIKDSNVAQISAFLYYQANVLANLEKNSAFQHLFRTTVFNQINKDFGEYMDSQSRLRPKALHHVYEWGKIGSPKARLFKLNMLQGNGLSFKLNYEFTLSKTRVPSSNPKQKRKYIFENKASIMEKGMPIVIAPKSAQRLVFEMNGETIFMPKGASVTVKSPGGTATTNQFDLAYSRWFSGPLVSNSIKASGFKDIFGQKMSKALSIPNSIKKIQYSFSPNSIKMQAEEALVNSFGGAI